MQTIFDTTQVTSPENGSNPKPGDPCHPLVKNGHVPLLVDQNEGGNDVVCDTMTKSKNLTTSTHGGIAPHNKTLVRRLTPLECERLQGFPDGYTNIPGASDSKRYAALGNSMTVQVMEFIGRRIDMVDKAMKELATK